MSVSVQLESIISFAISAFMITGLAVIGSRAISSIPSEEHEEHHSIPWEDKIRLTEQYGKWAVNRSEGFCPENDVACVEREAKRLLEVYRYRREV